MQHPRIQCDGIGPKTKSKFALYGMGRILGYMDRYLDDGNAANLTQIQKEVDSINKYHNNDPVRTVRNFFREYNSNNPQSKIKAPVHLHNLDVFYSSMQQFHPGSINEDRVSDLRWKLFKVLDAVNQTPSEEDEHMCTC